jgi:hypothetical protein
LSILPLCPEQFDEGAVLLCFRGAAQGAVFYHPHNFLHLARKWSTVSGS